MSDSLRPHESQHTRPPCPSPTPGAYSNSCPLSWWCHPAISSSVVLFSSHLQSFPASGAFPMSQFFTLGGQSIGVSASGSVLPMNIQDWFPLRLVVYPCSLGHSQESSLTPQFKSINSSVVSFLYSPTLTSIHDYWKNHYFDLLAKVMSLLFNMLSRFVIAFLPRSKCVLISWLQSLSNMILELMKIKSVTVSSFSPSICHEVMGPDAMILVLWALSFQPAFPSILQMRNWGLEMWDAFPTLNH